MLFNSLVIAVAFALMPVTLGCGGGDGTSVIQPGEDYQLTPQEQKNKELEMEARRNGN
jgi:hypothetical protein